MPTIHVFAESLHGQTVAYICEHNDSFTDQVVITIPEGQTGMVVRDNRVSIKLPMAVISRLAAGKLLSESRK